MRTVKHFPLKTPVSLPGGEESRITAIITYTDSVRYRCPTEDGDSEFEQWQLKVEDGTRKVSTRFIETQEPGE